LHVYDPAVNAWDKLENAPLPHGNGAAGVIGGKFYLVGGCDWTGKETAQLDVYDPATNAWITLTSMPTPRNYPAAAVFNGKLYVVGGNVNVNTALVNLEVYDPVQDTWSIGPPMRIPRAGAQSAVIGQRLYVVGGNPPNGLADTAGEVEAYDFLAGNWSFVTPIPHTRNNAFVAALNGKLYVAGGFPKTAEIPPSEVYNPATDTWESFAPMPVAAYQGAGAQVVDGRIWAIGGWIPGEMDPQAKVAHNQVFIYDPSLNSWSISGRKR
jgi:N-acetylneuraminic acid mutarotase